ncbi:MAG: CbiX/SirB N-terminal domain-containing protein [Cyclobacteriaceae bacterium]|nr:CbiX/SirB N-terminal domain-containing protein [Cyclobacteriaceae bacterium]
MKSIASILIISAGLMAQLACSSSSGETAQTSRPANSKKIGVLLVNHGSRSATWRQALLALEENVKDSLVGYGKIHGTKTAFMEYNEPSIATRLKEFDAEGYTDVIIVPIFLTVSSHSFDDIPTIIGKKEDPQSLETLKIEKIERYTPQAATQIAPLLDFSGMLKENILRRALQLSKEPQKEGLVMIAYGDATYMKEWSALLHDVGAYVKQHSAIDAYSFGWCGHVAHYNPDSTTVAIKRVFTQKEKALVVPVLVAHDEMFQVKIIGDGIAKTGKRQQDVAYVADSILPDKNIERWVIRIAREHADKLVNNSQAQLP